MIQSDASTKAQNNGRPWIVFPLLIVHIGAAVWFGTQWEPPLDYWTFVIVASISIAIPSAWIFDKPSVFREPWTVGLVLQMFGVMIMAMRGVLNSLGALERAPPMGVSFFMCVFGLIWFSVYLFLFGASRLIKVARQTPNDAQHLPH